MGPVENDRMTSEMPVAVSSPGGNSVRVIVFSGGRGSRALTRELIHHARVRLTLAINGYDDGASTGEVRHFLGDCLGPSDFRKNASRLARELRTCPGELIDLMDRRFPVGCSREEALSVFRLLDRAAPDQASAMAAAWRQQIESIPIADREELGTRLRAFTRELAASGRDFSFSDCSIGNLVFAGSFLETGRDFNLAIADYCALLGLPAGLMENVTNGENAFLVALNEENRLLSSEAEMVDATRRNRIKDIFLIDRPLQQADRERWDGAREEEILAFLRQRARTVTANLRLLAAIAEADLIIYAPGTQHSSLFPSYLTPGLGAAIARNLTALKILITNLQEDAEIPALTGVDIIERAAFYLKDRHRLSVPTPCLITHYLLNDHGRKDEEKPYIPLGRLESLEDPRMVRVGNFEEGITGRHDAAKVLLPFIEAILQREEGWRVAVWLLQTDSLNKITQTLLEGVRGSIAQLPVSLSVYYHSQESLPSSFTELLPFPVRNVAAEGLAKSEAFLRSLEQAPSDYVVLFESSGMYKGEEIVNLVSLLTHHRLDGIWGSRRLSTRDIRESYKLRYRRHSILGAISYLGSHLLSLGLLFRYGRYVSDTLTGVRAVKTAYLMGSGLAIDHPCLNHQLLALMLSEQADILESPVQFFPMSPEKVRRTSILDGLRSLLTILFWRPQSGAKGSDAV